MKKYSVVHVLALTMALGFGSAIAAEKSATEKSVAIYECQSDDEKVELSNLCAGDGAEVVVEGTVPPDTPAEPRAAARTRADADTLPADAVASGGAAQASANVAASPVPSSSGGASSGYAGVAPAGAINFGGAGQSGAIAAMPDAGGAVGTGSAAPGNVATQPVTTGPSTVHPSILDNPSALEARAQQYRELMLHAPLEADGKPANPAIVRRYLMTTRSAFQGGR